MPGDWEERLNRQRNMTASELGRHYGDRLKPTEPRTWEEEEMRRAMNGEDDAGHGGVIAVLGVLAGAVSVALLCWGGQAIIERIF